MLNFFQSFFTSLTVSKNINYNLLKISTFNTILFVLPHIIRGKSKYEDGYFAEVRRYKGTTLVKAYKTDGGKAAEGKGTLDEYDLFLTTLTTQTTFYLSPQIGYFARTVKLKDFGKDVSALNSGREGFIPGITTDSATGEEIDISSLSYKSSFYSGYFGFRGGLNLSAGTLKVLYFFNPSIFVNLIEYRKTIVDNGSRSFQKSQFQIPDYRYKPFINSLGISLDTGFYFSSIRTGIRGGLEYAYFREFQFERPIEFRENYYDTEHDLYRQDRITAKSSQISSTRFYLSLFFKFWGDE